MAIILLSDSSLRSDWVKYEIGALWALNKEIAPALLCDVKKVPEIISEKFQAMPVKTDMERLEFCHEVDKYLKELDAQKG